MKTLTKEQAVTFVKNQGLIDTLLIGSRTRPIYLEDLLLLFVESLQEDKDEKAITEFNLYDLFYDLQMNAYDIDFNGYHNKEANQIIRKHFEQFANQPKVSDEDIEKWAIGLANIRWPGMMQFTDEWHNEKNILIKGAKAHRDGQIPPAKVNSINLN
jgi:hypothetical protein